MNKKMAKQVLENVNARTATRLVRAAVFALTGIPLSDSQARTLRRLALENVKVADGAVCAGLGGKEYYCVLADGGVVHTKDGIRAVTAAEDQKAFAARAGLLAYRADGTAYLPERGWRIPRRIFALGAEIAAGGEKRFVHAVRAMARDGWVVAAAVEYRHGVPVLWDVLFRDADGETTFAARVPTWRAVEFLRGYEPDTRRWQNAARVPTKLAATLDGGLVVAPGYGVRKDGKTAVVWLEDLDTARVSGLVVGDTPRAVGKVDPATWAEFSATFNYPDAPHAWCLYHAGWADGLNGYAGGGVWATKNITASPVVATWYLRALQPDARKWRVVK